MFVCTMPCTSCSYSIFRSSYNKKKTLAKVVATTLKIMQASFIDLITHIYYSKGLGYVLLLPTNAELEIRANPYHYGLICVKKCNFHLETFKFNTFLKCFRKWQGGCLTSKILRMLVLRMLLLFWFCLNCEK